MMKMMLDFLGIMTQKNGDFIHHDIKILNFLRGLNEKGRKLMTFFVRSWTQNARCF